ncbi:MAG TPA: GNAT family N-acetyltransferase [Burkholderiales bacterium]|nr:GNAT family N-acetyltransferase [Burkholderiales bacterium]
MKVEWHDRSSMSSLVPEWDGLAAAAAEPNPYYEHWALLPALDTCGADVGLEAAAVRVGGELAGLFFFEPVARWRGLPVRALRAWRSRHMLLGTPLVRAGMEEAAIAALLGALRERASVVEMPYLHADGPVCRALRAALASAGRPWHADQGFERALLRRGADAEGYLAAALDGDRRRELRRKEKRLKDAGEVRYVRLGPDGDVARWIDDFVRIEASGWKARAGGALACREADLAFSRALFRGAFERGRLMATGLDVDGKAVARELCLLAGEGAFSVRIAYDEAFARFAPGMLCELENIRAFHAAPPRLQWMDSYTSAENTTIGRLWKERRRIERLTAAVDGYGAFVLSLLPWLRRAKETLTSASAALGARAGRTRTASPSSSSPSRTPRTPAGSAPS